MSDDKEEYIYILYKNKKIKKIEEAGGEEVKKGEEGRDCVILHHKKNQKINVSNQPSYWEYKFS